MNASPLAAVAKPPCQRRSHPASFHPWTVLVLAALFWCLPGANVFAQGEAAPAASTDFTELNLEDLMQVKVPTVYGASKHEQKITEAPAAVTIVTKEEIKKLGYRTLADILRGVRGWYVTDDRIYNYAGVRGINQPGDFGGRVLLMIDGHRLNDPVYDSTSLGEDFPLDVELIERVEVIRGPGSTLYGNNAFFGVINVITRNPADFKNGEVSTMVGSFDTYGGRFSVAHQYTNGVKMLLSGTFFDTEGDSDVTYLDSTAGQPLPSNQNLAYEEAYKFFGTVAYQDFTLSALYGQRETAVPPGAFATDYDDPRNYITDTRAYTELKYQHTLASDWKTIARLYYDYYDYEGNLPYDFGDPFITIYRNEATAHFWGGELQLSKKLMDRHLVTFGLEGRHDAYVSQNDYNGNVPPATPTTYIDESSSAGSFGLYGQSDTSITTNFNIVAGVRYDYFSTFGSTVNPRIAAIYNPWSETTLKALYGHAYRAPNANEFEYQGANYVGNKDLQPERIRSYELVLEQGIAKNYRFTLSGFYNDIEDLITQTTTGGGLFIYENTSAVEVFGLSTELEGRWDNGLIGRVSYTYADAEDANTGARLNNSPEHLVKLQLIAPVFCDKLSIGFEVLGQSEVTGAFPGVPGNEISGRLIGNLTLFSHELFDNLDMSLGIYNLWNEEYYDPVASDFTTVSAPQDGRSYRFKLTYKF
jgi:outer membrane receptor for ferrienterochelin and colicins